MRRLKSLAFAWLTLPPCFDTPQFVWSHDSTLNYLTYSFFCFASICIFCAGKSVVQHLCEVPDRIEKWRKKPSNQRDSNPRPLCHEACTQPLCCVRCPTQPILQKSYQAVIEPSLPRASTFPKMKTIMINLELVVLGEERKEALMEISWSTDVD